MNKCCMASLTLRNQRTYLHDFDGKGGNGVSISESAAAGTWLLCDIRCARLSENSVKCGFSNVLHVIFKQYV